MAVELDDGTRQLLDGRNFASLATVGPDGSPQSSVVWFRRDGDSLLFSTAATRQKARNVARDPRVSVTVFDLDDPYHSVEIRGRAEVLDDTPRALPRELSQRYLGEDPPPEPPEVRRLIVRVVPEKVNRFRA